MQFDIDANPIALSQQVDELESAGADPADVQFLRSQIDLLDPLFVSGEFSEATEIIEGMEDTTCLVSALFSIPLVS